MARGERGDSTKQTISHWITWRSLVEAHIVHLLWRLLELPFLPESTLSFHCGRCVAGARGPRRSTPNPPARLSKDDDRLHPPQRASFADVNTYLRCRQMRYSLTHNLHLQVQNYNNFLIIATSSLPFHRHLILLRHFLCEGFLAILFDIADAGGTVAVEQESKDLANKVVMNLAFLYIWMSRNWIFHVVSCHRCIVIARSKLSKALCTF